MSSRTPLLVVIIAALVFGVACGGGSIGNKVSSYTISVNVTGLASGASVVLQDNGGDNLPITTNATVPFATPIASGSTYAVTVLTQPAGQTCTPGSNASGTANSNITVTVTCATNTYTISAAVTGLASGASVVLQDNGGDNLTITTNVTVPFATPIASGSTYAVTVLTQPTGQTCTLGSNASGTANSNVTVTVTCAATTYTISAAVSGLTGTGLVLQDNGADNLSVTADGTYPFATPIAINGTYAVTILTQPSGQTCFLGSNASGTATANVTVTVTCMALYTISANVSGLTGGTLVLQDNGGNNLSVTANGTFPFTTQIVSGSPYAVTILTQPAGQTCTLGSNASGTVTGPVTVAVTCATNATLSLSAAVTGLTGTLVLQDDAGKQLTFTTNSTQAFSNLYVSGATYSVNVFTQPASQVCTLGSNASGTITANTTVQVTCTTNLTISATVTGLTGTLVLQDDKTDQLTFTANGTQTFASAYASGSTYSVTVVTQPVGQTCTLSSNASGTITANVTVTATCVSNFTLSVAVTGLAGTLVVQDSQSDQLTFTTNSTQTFTKTYAGGSAYTVTVVTQPTGQTCTLSSNASGTIMANTTVTATCTTNAANYTISVAVTGLTGTLVMQDDKADTLTFTTNSTQSFATQYAGGSTYTVSVKTQPTGQTCGLSSNSTGTISANITVTASCVAGSGFTIGGTLYDLSLSTSTTGVVLLDNNADSMTLTQNGTFTFATPVTGAYSVTVATNGQPSNPDQTCTVNNGSGTASGNVTNVQVVCIGEWTWINGSETISQTGQYGTKRSQSGGDPGARYGSSTWIDASGNMWLFGGIGYDSEVSGAESELNDLWFFAPGVGWEYFAGSTLNQQVGIYPSGVGQTGGTPGSRSNAVNWIDSAGNLWFFGGYVVDQAGLTADAFNDLWEFTAGSGGGNQFIWQGGATVGNQQGTYNGIGNAGTPGARYWSTGAVDASGNFWMFGGQGIDANGGGTPALLNDIWEYVPGSNQWFFQGGSTTAGAKGVYTGSSQVPGARIGASSWIDSSGNFWLFGGIAIDSKNFTGDMNDLWEFSLSTKKWTFVGGSQTNGAGGTYGTQGIPASANTPDARTWGTTWQAPNGDVWLFGGTVSSGRVFNDLWKYSGGQWSFMAGNEGSSDFYTGVYGTQGHPSPSNVPGGRSEGGSWTDANGNLWLFGGFGLGSAQTPYDSINDLWEFQP